MKCLKRNQRPIWYCLYQGETELNDSDGNYTGETEITYAAPVQILANVSPATGQSDMEMFGNLTDYDRVIVSDDTTLQIDENTVLFIDSTPTDGAGETGYDYIVRRVAKSINSVAIAVQKVKVTVVKSTSPAQTTEPEGPVEDEPPATDGE